MSIVEGWYEDPEDPALLRYWDGAGWTDETAPAQAPEPTPAPLAPMPSAPVQPSASATPPPSATPSVPGYPGPAARHGSGPFDGPDRIRNFIVSAVALLAVVGILAAMLLGGGGDDSSEGASGGSTSSERTGDVSYVGIVIKNTGTVTYTPANGKVLTVTRGKSLTTSQNRLIACVPVTPSMHEQLIGYGRYLKERYDPQVDHGVKGEFGIEPTSAVVAFISNGDGVPPTSVGAIGDDVVPADPRLMEAIAFANGRIAAAIKDSRHRPASGSVCSG